MSRTCPGTPMHKGGTVPLSSQGQVSRRELKKSRISLDILPALSNSWLRDFLRKRRYLCVFCFWSHFAFKKKLLSGSRRAFSNPKAQRDELHEMPPEKIYQLFCVLESVSHKMSEKRAFLSSLLPTKHS